MPECGWEGDEMGVGMCSFNLHMSAEVSQGVFEGDVVKLQNPGRL